MRKPVALEVLYSELEVAFTIIQRAYEVPADRVINLRTIDAVILTRGSIGTLAADTLMRLQTLRLVSSPDSVTRADVAVTALADLEDHLRRLLDDNDIRSEAVRPLDEISRHRLKSLWLELHDCAQQLISSLELAPLGNNEPIAYIHGSNLPEGDADAESEAGA